MKESLPGDSKRVIRNSKDKELLAVYHYARLRGAKMKDAEAIERAAAMLDISGGQFKKEIWPKYKNQEGVKQAEELARNSPGTYPDFSA